MPLREAGMAAHRQQKLRNHPQIQHAPATRPRVFLRDRTTGKERHHDETGSHFFEKGNDADAVPARRAGRADHYASFAAASRGYRLAYAGNASDDAVRSGGIQAGKRPPSAGQPCRQPEADGFPFPFPGLRCFLFFHVRYKRRLADYLCSADHHAVPGRRKGKIHPAGDLHGKRRCDPRIAPDAFRQSPESFPVR